jgi:Competence protein
MLINGRRDAIDQHLYDAMFVSGIGHVLSISGYHVAVVAGAMFFLIRAFLALIPGLADEPGQKMRDSDLLGHPLAKFCGREKPETRPGQARRSRRAADGPSGRPGPRSCISHVMALRTVQRHRAPLTRLSGSHAQAGAMLPWRVVGGQELWRTRSRRRRKASPRCRAGRRYG